MSLSKEVHMITDEESDRRNNFLLDKMINDPFIRDENGNTHREFSKSEIFEIYEKAKHNRESEKAVIMSLEELVYLSSKFCKQNVYQRNLVKHAWGPATDNKFLETLCVKDNMLLMPACLFANYSNRNDDKYNYIDDENCLYELPDFANRNHVLCRLLTGKMKYKGKSFNEWYNDVESPLKTYNIAVIIDFRIKTFQTRLENFLLFQTQKVVSQSNQLKNVDNSLNRFLFKTNQMVSFESTMVNIYENNCFVNGTSYWYYNGYRFLDVYIHQDYSIENITKIIARTDEHYKPMIKLDNKKDFVMTDEQYTQFLSKLSHFNDFINGSGQRYTYGTIPLFWYIYLNQCYDVDGNIDATLVELLRDKIYTYATLDDYKKVWINRQTDKPGVLYTKEDVVELLNYESTKFINNTGTTRPNILASLPTRPPIPRSIKHNVDIRDSRSDGECKCCYQIVGSSQLVYGHIESYSDSRNHDEDNIILICDNCNKFAGKQDMRDFQKEHYSDNIPIDDYIQSMKDIEFD